MPPRDPAITSRIMKRIPQRDTASEVCLRKELHARGLRYRKNLLTLPGKPDIVFVRVKLCVFVDGDFWHGREWQTRGYSTLGEAFKRNREFWVSKIQGNAQRDARTTAKLEEAGWAVLRFWESDVSGNVRQVADKIEKALADLDRRRKAT